MRSATQLVGRAILAMACIARPGMAQTQGDVAKADALFNAGRSLLEAGEYADACPKFAEAQKIAPGLGVTLYLADCYERLGKTASSLTEFRRAEQIATTRGDKRGHVAHERAARLEEKVPSLILVVPPPARADGLSITREGEPVAAESWGWPVTLDPGKYEVIVSAPGKQPQHLVVLLPAKRGATTLTVAPLQDLAQAGASPTPQNDTPPAPSTRADAAPPRSSSKVIAVTVGGAGVVALGVGAILGFTAKSRLDDSNSGPCDATDRCDATGLGLRKDAEHLATASTVLFLVGGVAAAGGIVLYLMAPRASRPSAVGISPWGARGGAGLSLVDTW